MFISDFEDMSCEMVYGQVPPPFEEDPVSKQPCYADICKFVKFLLCGPWTFKIFLFPKYSNICRLHLKSQLQCLS